MNESLRAFKDRCELDADHGIEQMTFKELNNNQLKLRASPGAQRQTTTARHPASSTSMRSEPWRALQESMLHAEQSDTIDMDVACRLT
jgi:hypothetical protein